MNDLQRFIKKHDGSYQEESKKSVHTHEGKFSSQKVWGTLFLKGYKVSIGFIEMSDAHPNATSFEIKMKVENTANHRLLIVPRGFLSSRFRSWLHGTKSTLIQKIKARYRFSGSTPVLDAIRNNRTFLEFIDAENLCIMVNKKTPNTISVTTVNGYRNEDHLEQLAEVLFEVKNTIDTIK